VPVVDLVAEVGYLQSEVDRHNSLILTLDTKTKSIRGSKEATLEPDTTAVRKLEQTIRERPLNDKLISSHTRRNMLEEMIEKKIDDLGDRLSQINRMQKRQQEELTAMLNYPLFRKLTFIMFPVGLLFLLYAATKRFRKKF